MRKLALSIAVAASVASLPALAYDAKSTATGGATVASGDFRAAGVNPALASISKGSDDFSIQLHGGLEASDNDQMLDGINDLQTAIDDLDRKINDGSAVPGDEQEVLDRLAALSNRVVELGVGTGISLSIPSNYVGTSLFVRSDARFGLDFDYDSDDDNRIRNNLIAGDPVDTGLQSRVRGSGYGITEVGLALSHTYPELGIGDLSVGIAPKYLRVDLFDNEQTISGFETADINDSLTEESGFNADIGAMYEFGEERQYRVGASIKHLIPVEVEGQSGETYELNPLATVGAAYRSSWFMATLEADLTKTEGYGRIEDSQYARAGIELDAFDWAQLRLGFRHDFEAGREDVLTAGIGLSPFDVVNIDIAGVYGENDTYGAVIQLGVGF